MVTETSEKQGQLYEKINQAKPYVSLIHKEQAVAILDEAKKEFPKRTDVKVCNNSLQVQFPDYSDYQTWFKKNFGESKTEKEKQETK